MAAVVSDNDLSSINRQYYTNHSAVIKLHSIPSPSSSIYTYSVPSLDRSDGRNPLSSVIGGGSRDDDNSDGDDDNGRPIPENLGRPDQAIPAQPISWFHIFPSSRNESEMNEIFEGPFLDAKNGSLTDAEKNGSLEYMSAINMNETLEGSPLLVKDETSHDLFPPVKNVSLEDSWLPMKNIASTEDSSCCALLAEKFAAAYPEILDGPAFSRLLLSGILLDTGNLSHPTCTLKDKCMASLLIKGADRFGMDGLCQIRSLICYIRTSRDGLSSVQKL
ncbi:hypothetical protein MLD38_011003 [Melastoma candidum]|uniref:Uncharacterized protein n=1 Tax=Melastoma candidum TaxID=119954 RepID=A0ACB9R275_9MYRT|nr:hypothetical protein MLD38_011003 [Melastoma candidum]